jgi:hypothetical protein
VAIRFDYVRGGREVSFRLKILFTERLHCAGRMLIGSTLLAGLTLGAAMPVAAQYPGQVKQNQQNQTMRAIAVLEWSGDEQKPKASRLVPVVLYDGEHLEDAGIYMARPAPLALSSEVEYELKDNGKTTGLFVVSTAGQEQGSWLGFGAWKPLPKPKPPAPAKIDSSKDEWGNEKDDKPVLHRKQHDDKQGSDNTTSDESGAKAPSDPDRPTLHKKTSSNDSDNSNSSDSKASSTDSPANPDRPTLHKKTSDNDSSNGGDAASGGATPVDPDRPTLKKKTEKPQQAAQTVDEGHVESVQKLSDPDRPKLSRGKPAEQGGKVLPTLMGMPPDLHQAVAVSDAKNRPEHLWTYSWANAADEGNMKAAMEDIAREALGLNKLTQPAIPEPSKVKATSSRTTAPTRRKVTPPPPVASAPLLDEQFRVFELAYGSGATMVLSARTDGEGEKQKFITLICQPNIYGKVTVLFKNVTDGSHLDESPRMRLVDAVDVMADNRGELLFELRGATQRQFALYRVLRGQATKLFSTAPSSIVQDANDSSTDSHS